MKISRAGRTSLPATLDVHTCWHGSCVRVRRSTVRAELTPPFLITKRTTDRPTWLEVEAGMDGGRRHEIHRIGNMHRGRGMQERQCSEKEEDEVQQRGLEWRRETKGNSCGQFFPEFRSPLRAPPLTLRSACFTRPWPWYSANWSNGVKRVD